MTVLRNIEKSLVKLTFPPSAQGWLLLLGRKANENPCRKSLETLRETNVSAREALREAHTFSSEINENLRKTNVSAQIVYPFSGS